MAEHIHFNNEVTIAKLVAEKNYNQTAQFFSIQFPHNTDD